MALTFAAFMADVTAGMEALKAVEPAALVVYKAVAKMAGDAEDAYDASQKAGATKLASVLAGGKAVAADVGEDWSALVADVTSFITTAKSNYNTVVATVEANSASAAATTQTAAVVTPAVATDAATSIADATAGTAAVAA